MNLSHPLRTGLARYSLITLAILFLAAGPACAQTARSQSPASVVRAYGTDLTLGKLDAVWRYGFGYNYELTLKLKPLPKSMWDEATGALRAQWERNVQEMREQVPGISNLSCFQVFRPGARFTIQETRQQDAVNWVSFVQVDYPSEEQALVAAVRGSGRRRVASLLARVRVVLDDMQRLQVADACAVVEESISLYGHSGLRQDSALELARAGLGDLRPYIELGPPAWNLHVVDAITGRRLPEPYEQVERLNQILRRHGVTIDTEIRGGYYQQKGIHLPDSWQQYVMKPFRTARGELVSRPYSLVQSQQISLVGPPLHVDEDTAVATITITYQGLSPIGALVKELRETPEPKGPWYVFPNLGLMVFPNFNYDVERNGQSGKVHCAWTLEKGWQLVGFGEFQLSSGKIY